jgi:hypothetical protein
MIEDFYLPNLKHVEIHRDKEEPLEEYCDSANREFTVLKAIETLILDFFFEPLYNTDLSGLTNLVLILDMNPKPIPNEFSQLTSLTAKIYKSANRVPLIKAMDLKELVIKCQKGSYFDESTLGSTFAEYPQLTKILYTSNKLQRFKSQSVSPWFSNNHPGKIGESSRFGSHKCVT